MESVQEAFIKANLEMILRELSLTDFYRAEGAGRVTIGPLVSAATGLDYYLDEAESHAAMVPWVAHMVRRFHERLTLDLRQNDPSATVDWLPLFFDRFPGQYKDLGKIFSACFTHPGIAQFGNIRTAYHTDRHDPPGLVLADNISGCLNAYRKTGENKAAVDAFLASGGVYYCASSSCR